MKRSLYFSLFLLLLATTYYAQEPDANKRKHLMELSAKYPKGMSRDSSKEKNCNVQRWIWVEDKETCATEYEQRTYSWGATYYFENRVSISKERFLSGINRK